MNHAARAAHIEDLIDELVALHLAQAANLREFAQAMVAGEGTIQLERALRHREVQRAELYRRFEQAAFAASQEPEA